MDNACSPSQILVKRQISVEDDTIVIFATQPRPFSHAHRNSSCQTAEPLCKNIVEQAKCYKSGTDTHSRSWLLLVKNTRANVNYRRCFCFKPLKQRTKHHVLDGRPMAEVSLAATKQKEVEPHDDITFVYWSVMTPLLVYWSK